jgi:tripartite-type tricarboxylate transporter receptor subunit TctC
MGAYKQRSPDVTRAERERGCRLLIAVAALLAGFWMLAAPVMAVAQGGYPDKPIRLIVPFPPGGGADSLARAITPALSQALGQQVLVENRPGAGGNVGSEAAAKSASDGYTILYGTNGTFGINHGLYQRTGFDPVKDFEPIGRIGRIGVVLVVHPDLPAKTVSELIGYLKDNPGKATFASAGNGTTSHIAGELFKAATATQIVHVPYKGNGPAMIDLMAGRVNMMLDVMPSAYPRVKAGKLRALAVATISPVDIAPDLPTLHAAGVSGFDVSAWDGLWAPAGTSRPIIDKLNAALRQALADPQTRNRLLGLGSEPVPGTPEDLAKHVAVELPKWADAVKRSGAKID